MPTRTCEHCGVEFEGAPQARFHSDACRKAAARARLADPRLPVRDVRSELQTPAPSAEPDPKPIPPPTPVPPPRGMPSLEQYVGEALLGAELAHAQASPQATHSTKSLAETLERAEQYARWRYAGVLEGTVNGL